MKKSIKKILAIIAIASTLIGTSVVGVCYNVEASDITPEKLTVSTTEEAITYGTFKYSVVDIIREKDREPMYVIRLDGFIGKGDISMTETQYQTYLGDDVNAVTVNAYVIKAVTGNTWERVFPPKSEEITLKRGSLVYRGYRFVYPWDEHTEPFSEEDKEQFVQRVCYSDEFFSLYPTDLCDIFI